MNKPYIICHMMAALDGRIDCGMTVKLPGVDEYYETLNALNVPTTVNGTGTAVLELAERGRLEAEAHTPVGEECVYKAADAQGYSVVVSTRGDLLWKDELVDGKPLIMVLSEKADREYLDYLKGKGISFIVAGKEHPDLCRASEILADTFGVKRMGIVGGARINAGFLDAGLLDEVSMVYAPGIDGRGGMLAAFDGLPMEREPFALHLDSVKAFDNGCVWLRYHVK